MKIYIPKISELSKVCYAIKGKFSIRRHNIRCNINERDIYED